MKQGNYADGGGLYLQVTKSGAKSWIYKFMLNGRAREMGLGPLHTVSLPVARDNGAERWSDMPAPLSARFLCRKSMWR